MDKNIQGKSHDHRSQPTAEEHQSQRHRNKLNGERERLLLDLSGSLEDGDNNSEEHADKDRRSRQNKDEQQALVSQLDNVCLIHVFLLPPQWNVDTKPSTSNVQPSNMTSRNSFSGMEIVTGDNIIIPIASRMSDVTKSMTKKGM